MCMYLVSHSLAGGLRAPCIAAALNLFRFYYHFCPRTPPSHTYATAHVKNCRETPAIDLPADPITPPTLSCPALTRPQRLACIRGYKMLLFFLHFQRDSEAKQKQQQDNR